MEIVNAMIDNAVQILLALLLSLLVMGLQYVKQLVAEKLKMQTLSIALDELDNAVYSTVGELQQTVVDGLKAGAEDGKLDPDEVKALGEKLVEITCSKLSQPAADIINAAGIDLIAYIKSLGEHYVHELKVAKTEA